MSTDEETVVYADATISALAADLGPVTAAYLHHAYTEWAEVYERRILVELAILLLSGPVREDCLAGKVTPAVQDVLLNPPFAKHYLIGRKWETGRLECWSGRGVNVISLMRRLAGAPQEWPPIAIRGVPVHPTVCTNTASGLDPEGIPP